MLIKVDIASFAVDTSRNSPVIILKESSGDRTLAVPVGPIEASAIAIESLKVKPEKPFTIDLVKVVMELMGGKLSRVLIDDIVEKSIFSKLQIVVESKVLLVDCRPCDALALAIRCGAPIYVKDIVFEKTVTGRSLTEKEKLRKHLSSIDTLEFGRYILE